MPVRCADCHTTFALTPDGPVVHAACPGCGGHRFEPDQPSPTRSDFGLRDMVNPDTGQDMGGNPLQEGILADNGWQPTYKRDESFASVKNATTPAYHEIEVTPGPNGIHHRVIGLLHKLHSITIDGHPVSFEGNQTNSDFLYGRYGHMGAENQRPVMVGAHDPAFADMAAKIIQSSKADPREVMAEAQAIKRGLAEGTVALPPKPGPRPEQYGGTQNTSIARVASDDDFDFDLDDFDKSPQHIFIVTKGGKVVSADANTHTHETLGAQHGLLRPDNDSPLKGHSLGVIHDNGDVDFVQHESGHSPGALGQMLWGHFGKQFVVNPNLKATTNEERWFGEGTTPDSLEKIKQNRINNMLEQQQLDLVPGRREEMQRAEQARGAPFGYYNNPYINRGGSVMTARVGERTSNMEPYLPWEYETIEKTAGPAAALLPALGIGAGEAAGGGMLGMAAPWLMRGALMGTGSNMIQGLFGGGDDAAGQQPSSPPQTLQQLAKTADLETPHANPVLHDDPDGDTKQYRDGDNSTDFQNPNNDASGPAGAQGEDAVDGGIGPEQPGMDSFAPESPALERFKMLLPLIQHYHGSPESGANDPLIRELHSMMEGELPGYLEKGDEGAATQLLQSLREPDRVHASIHEAIGVYENTPISPAQMQMGNQQMSMDMLPTMQPGGGIPGVGRQGTCPYCGGTQTADGSCPQCGAKTTPMGGAMPGAQPGQQSMPPVAPGGVPLAPPAQGLGQPYSRTAGDNQGPNTPEQIAAVQKLLIDTGRVEEVPNVPIEPWNYTRELAAVAQRPNVAPNVDPSEQPPPAPMQEVAPPGATMPVPNPADPSMQQAMASTRRKRSWRTSLDNVGPQPSDPNVIDAPAADQRHQRDLSQEQDSSHSWQDTTGAPLQTGQIYTVHNPTYEIPDIVRIEQVKPDAIVVSYLGTYQNSPSPDGQPGPQIDRKHEIPRHEVEVEGLTFEPGDSTGTNDQSPEDYQDTTSQNPVNTEPQMAPDVDAQAGQLRSHVEEGARDPDDDNCPRCASEHITSSMSSPTTSFHECYRCGHGWETREEEYGDRVASVDLSWLNEDTSPGGDDFFAQYERVRGMKEAVGGSKSLGAIAARDTRYQEIKERLDQNAQERTAGAKYTPREQREFISERGVARNADLLDLDGTHYESSRTKGDYERANAMNVPDEHMFLGFPG